MWSKKAGTRIREQVLSVARLASRQGVLVVRGEFYWFPNQACVVRSRADTQIPGNRIAPEEITAAITRVLDYGRSHARATLVNEVRALFGYNRTGAILDEAIGRVVDEMLERGQLGQGSSGLVLRVTPP